MFDRLQSRVSSINHEGQGIQEVGKGQLLNDNKSAEESLWRINKLSSVVKNDKQLYLRSLGECCHFLKELILFLREMKFHFNAKQLKQCHRNLLTKVWLSWVNPIEETHLRRSNVPMYHLSVIFKVEQFIPSLNFVIVLQYVVINSCSICVFVDDVPHMSHIFKQVLPNHLLQCFLISHLWLLNVRSFRPTKMVGF